MSNKNSPKRVNQLCHRLAVLADIMIDTIEELNTENIGGQTLKNSLEITKAHCEDLVEASFKVDGVLNSTYFNDLSTKIDTLIRKNYKEI